jgi:hypothetical protein
MSSLARHRQPEIKHRAVAADARLADTLGTKQLSYAAGSTSLDPDGYRLIGENDGQRLTQLLAVFPELSSIISPNCLIINAYPAALGLQGFAPYVDTYMHAPTLIRALRLAARHERPVVFAAQPIVGADLLSKAIDAGWELPRCMLWATGGYYFPQSLERHIAMRMNSAGCDVRFLHCYGVAEIAHTCFAATSRFSNGTPRYQKIIDAVEVGKSPDGFMTLAFNGRRVVTSDYAKQIDDEWSIDNGPSRLSLRVANELESWSDEEWFRRTGYLKSNQDSIQCQLREHIEVAETKTEHRFYRFWEAFGGSLQSKPQWHDDESMRLDGSAERASREACV